MVNIANETSKLNAAIYANNASGYQLITNKPYTDGNNIKTDVYISSDDDIYKKYWKNNDLDTNLDVYTELTEEYLKEYERQYPQSTIEKIKSANDSKDKTTYSTTTDVLTNNALISQL